MTPSQSKNRYDLKIGKHERDDLTILKKEMGKHCHSEVIRELIASYSRKTALGDNNYPKIE
jgi:hypothetical protein